MDTTPIADTVSAANLANNVLSEGDFGDMEDECVDMQPPPNLNLAAALGFEALAEELSEGMKAEETSPPRVEAPTCILDFRIL